MSAQDRKALLTAAVAAVEAARVACEAAGLVRDGSWGTQATPDMLDTVRDRAQLALDLAIASEAPIAIGDAVRVTVRRAASRNETLSSVGTKWITAGRSRYDIDHGVDERWSDRSIHPHDLARIQRWLVKPAKVKP